MLLKNKLLTFTKRASVILNPTLKVSSFPEKKVKIGQHHINYVKVGQGPHKLIFIPGALGTILASYKFQLNGFDLDTFTLVVFDPPGYGKSYPRKRVLDIKSYERDADTAYELMKYLQIPKYSSLGWSAGGSASLILAAKYPHAIHKLVVWAANAYLRQKEIDIYDHIRDINLWDEEYRNMMIESYGEERITKYWTEWVDGMGEAFQHERQMVSEEFLRKITCPTFILNGQKDVLTDMSHVAYLTKHINNTTVHVYPEGKHNIHMRYADDFNKRVQEFLLQD